MDENTYYLNPFNFERDWHEFQSQTRALSPKKRRNAESAYQLLQIVEETDSFSSETVQDSKYVPNLSMPKAVLSPDISNKELQQALWLNNICWRLLPDWTL